MKKVAISLVLMIGLIIGYTAPSQAFLDKTRFAAHLGIAYFVFHHWVQNPYRQGAFGQGAPHRTATMVKAGAAMLFAVHEVHVSQKIAANSKDPLLQRLSGGLTTMAASFVAIGTGLKHGNLNPTDVQSLGSQTDTISGEAAQDGAQIRDVPVAVPGT